MAERRSTNGANRAAQQIPATTKPGSIAMLPEDAPTPVAASPAKDPDSVPWYRRCPVCWGRNGGVGNVYTTNGNTRYYKCVQSCKPGGCACGHTWTATVKTEVIKVESRTIQIDHR